MGRGLLALLVAALAALGGAPTASAQISGGSVFSGKISCSVLGDAGVRFCQGSTAKRIRSFDGMPLDVNVALPTQTRLPPYPAVVLLHGWGGTKYAFATMERWAKRGYLVLSPSARGWGGSCGALNKDDATCSSGPYYSHIGDVRYEVRDVQQLTGMLVDEGLVDPKRIGATGGSYGGHASLALAALKDRVMLPDGSYAPWRSPAGRPMQLAAAAPEVPWTDLASALMPNGHDEGGPVGVMKQSFVQGYFQTGLDKSNYADPGSDPSADFTSWVALMNAGEPYSTPMEEALAEMRAHHSSYYIEDSREPAPLLVSAGWTDDLFPVSEALRFYERTRARHPLAKVGLHFIDYGHSRGRGRPEDVAQLKARIDAFMDHFLLGSAPEPFMGVEVKTQGCTSAGSGGPYRSDSWSELAKGEFRFAGEEMQTISSSGGDVSDGNLFDPIGGGGGCAVTDAADAAGTANYRAAVSQGFTLMGSPTVTAEITSPSPVTQLAARLLDVYPDGTTRLISRALYRPDASGRQTFQMHGNGWYVAPRHTLKLELLGADSPYGRRTNGAFAITVSGLEVVLPTLEAPGA
jgi:predicted acyl esterase